MNGYSSEIKTLQDIRENSSQSDLITSTAQGKKWSKLFASQRANTTTPPLVNEMALITCYA